LFRNQGRILISFLDFPHLLYGTGLRQGFGALLYYADADYPTMAPGYASHAWKLVPHILRNYEPDTNTTRSQALSKGELRIVYSRGTLLHTRGK
jgi:hypothetical protein